MILSVDIGTFDFKFFNGSVNQDLYDVITSNYESPGDGLDKIRNLLNLKTEELSKVDKLAISLYLRYYKAENKAEQFSRDLIKELTETEDQQLLLLYTGKKKLSKRDKKKLLSGEIDLNELLLKGKL